MKKYNVKRESGYDYNVPEEPARRIFLTPDKIRQMARDSKDGGRATCEVCGYGFAMYYIKYVKITPFRTGHVCLDCQREKKFQVAR